MKAVLARLGSFALIPALSLVTPLLVLPVVSRTAGGQGIVAMAVGQSIGGVASVVVALSWPLLGAAAIAVATVEERSRIYEESLAARLVAFLAVLPVVSLLTTLAVPSHLASALVAAVALSANGFGATWYYAGVGRARALVVLEVVPRVSANALAAAALALGAPLIVYPLLLLSSALCSVVAVSRSVLGRFPVLVWRDGIRSIRRSLRATAARGVNGLYNAGLTVTVALVAPGSALMFTATDRVQKSAFNSLTLAPEALVGWVAEAPPTERLRRAAVALALDFIVAFVAALLVIIGLPTIFRFLYADEVHADLVLRLVSGTVTFLLIFARGCLLHALVVHGRDALAANVVAIASVTGLPLVALGAAVGGAVGALGGVASAEALVCVCSLTAWLRFRLTGDNSFLAEPLPSDVVVLGPASSLDHLDLHPADETRKD